MEINKVHHMDFLNNKLPDKCAKLIIADPPYYRVKGEFDFIWDSFEDYLDDVFKWAREFKRLLADNGSLFWYGDALKIAYTQVIMDEMFHLLNSITWNKGSFMGLENSDQLMKFAPCTERILFYCSREMDPTGLQTIEKDFVAPRNPFALILKEAKEKKGVSNATIAEYGKFYGNVNHGGAVTNWIKGYNIPNADQWRILCENLPIERSDYNPIREEYEKIRKEYADLRRYFNNEFNLSEVMDFSNEATKTGSKHDHETVKPETLTRALIISTSRPKDLVLVPFAGSGTECAMSAEEGRNTIGFELKEKHVVDSNKRLTAIINKPKLF